MRRSTSDTRIIELSESHELMRPLLQLLNGLQQMPNALEERLKEAFEIQNANKGAVLLQEGKVCEYLWFLSEGILRSYHDIEDKEVTSRLMLSGHIVISPGSFFTQTPATESIEALTDCILLKISHRDLQNIYKEFPEFNYHTRIITELYFDKQEKRLYLLRKHDALPKYEYFLENYASLMQHIPQKYIASFLNITPETLSRVRAKLKDAGN